MVLPSSDTSPDSELIRGCKDWLVRICQEFSLRWVFSISSRQSIEPSVVYNMSRRVTKQLSHQLINFAKKLEVSYHFWDPLAVSAWYNLLLCVSFTISVLQYFHSFLTNLCRYALPCLLHPFYKVNLGDRWPHPSWRRRPRKVNLNVYLSVRMKSKCPFIFFFPFLCLLSIDYNLYFSTGIGKLE